MKQGIVRNKVERVYLSVEEQQRLEVHAVQQDMSKTALVRVALKKFLDSLDSQAPLSCR